MISMKQILTPMEKGQAFFLLKLLVGLFFQSVCFAYTLKKTILPIILVTCLKHDIMNSVKLQE